MFETLAIVVFAPVMLVPSLPRLSPVFDVLGPVGVLGRSGPLGPAGALVPPIKVLLVPNRVLAVPPTLLRAVPLPVSIVPVVLSVPMNVVYELVAQLDLPSPVVVLIVVPSPLPDGPVAVPMSLPTVACNVAQVLPIRRRAVALELSIPPVVLKVPPNVVYELVAQPDLRHPSVVKIRALSSVPLTPPMARVLTMGLLALTPGKKLPPRSVSIPGVALDELLVARMVIPALPLLGKSIALPFLAVELLNYRVGRHVLNELLPELFVALMTHRLPVLVVQTDLTRVTQVTGVIPALPANLRVDSPMESMIRPELEIHVGLTGLLLMIPLAAVEAAAVYVALHRAPFLAASIETTQLVPTLLLMLKTMLGMKPPFRRDYAPLATTLKSSRFRDGLESRGVASEQLTVWTLFVVRS